jgi:hypothetical protein
MNISESQFARIDHNSKPIATKTNLKFEAKIQVDEYQFETTSATTKETEETTTRPV